MSLELPKNISANIQNFTGRTWLLPIILQWYEQTNERMLILTGMPGTGKSMIAAWLAGAGPEPKNKENKNQLRRIRSSIKAAHFCVASSGWVAPRALAKNMAGQLVRNVEGFGAAAADVLKEHISISNEQHIGKIEPGAAVTGIHIDNLYIDGLSDELSFDRVLRETIKKLYEDGYNKSMILLVDSLDEAMTYTGSIKIVELLAKLDDLPDKVRFIVTTRPDPRVLKYYGKPKPSGLTKNSIDIIKDAPEDIDDVESYVHERLGGIDEALRKRLTEKISKASKGNFLYAQLVVSDLLQHPQTILDIETIPMPSSLGGIYQDFLTRELGKDEDRWYNSLMPILGLIIVAQGDGLSRTQINNIIGRDVTQYIRICKQYLEGDLPEGPFRPFHRSFVDFLLEDKENIDYHINDTEIHCRIIKFYLSTYLYQWCACDTYGLCYLPIHLVKAKQNQELKKLLQNFDWIQSKLKATDIISLISDFDLLKDIEELSHVRNALQLSAHVLAIDPAQLPSQLLGRLIDHESHQIRNLVKQIPKSVHNPWLRPMSRSLTSSGNSLIRTIEGHVGEITAITITADGKIISGSTEGDIKIWDIDTGKEIKTLRGHCGEIIAISVIPDGRIISVSNDSIIKTWDLDIGREIKTFKVGSCEGDVSFALTRDSKMLMSGYNGGVFIQDLENGKIIKALKGQCGIITAIATTIDGKIISRSLNSTINIWDLYSGQEIVALCKQSDDPSKAMAITDDNKIILGSFRGISVLDLSTYMETEIPDSPRECRALAITPDGKVVSAHDVDNTFRIWDLIKGKQIGIIKHKGALVRAIAISSDGRIVSGSVDGDIQVWRLNACGDAEKLKDYMDEISTIAVSHNGKNAISGSEGGIIKIWNIETCKEVKSFKAHRYGVTDIAIAPDGRVVSGSIIGGIRIWDLDKLKRIKTIRDIEGISAIAITLDGKVVVPEQRSGNIMILNLASGEVIRIPRSHYKWYESIAVATDGKIVIGSTNGTITIWDPNDGKEIKTIEKANYYDRFTPIAITHDDKIVSGDADGIIFIWSLDTGEEIKSFKGHTKMILAVATTTDGRVVSGSRDCIVKVWNLEKGNIIANFSGDGPITSIAITPDGNTILAAESGSNHIHFLHLENYEQ